MSTPQVIATKVVFDYIYAGGDPTATTPPSVVGLAVYATLENNLATTISPVTYLGATSIKASTDSNGYWSMNLIPNANISPSGTVYLITTPYASYRIIVPNSAGPFQSSAIVTTT